MDNYRPVSILPVLSKVLERAVHIQLYKYLQQNKILSPYQCGFRKCHSTEFAALSFSDNTRRNMDQGQLTGAVFIDLRKAFDTVDHAVLLDKLSNLGIVDKEHGWFTDFLSNRTQVVEFQGVTSTPEVASLLECLRVLSSVHFCLFYTLMTYRRWCPNAIFWCTLMTLFYTAHPLKHLLFKTSWLLICLKLNAGFLSIVCLLMYQKLKLCFSELPLDCLP